MTGIERHWAEEEEAEKRKLYEFLRNINAPEQVMMMHGFGLKSPLCGMLSALLGCGVEERKS